MLATLSVLASAFSGGHPPVITHSFFSCAFKFYQFFFNWSSLLSTLFMLIFFVDGMNVIFLIFYYSLITVNNVDKNLLFKRRHRRHSPSCLSITSHVCLEVCQVARCGECALTSYPAGHVVDQVSIISGRVVA